MITMFVTFQHIFYTLIRVSFNSQVCISISILHLSHPIHLFFQTLHIPENIVTSIPPPALLPPIMPLPLLLGPLPLLLLRRKCNLALTHHCRVTRRLGRFPLFKLTNTRTKRLVFRHRRRPSLPLVRRRNDHFGAALRAVTCFTVGAG